MHKHVKHCSLQAEAKRFLGALSKKAELKGSEQFTIEELFDVADTVELAVPDLSNFIGQLNEAGEAPVPKALDEKRAARSNAHSISL